MWRLQTKGQIQQNWHKVYGDLNNQKNPSSKKAIQIMNEYSRLELVLTTGENYFVKPNSARRENLYYIPLKRIWLSLRLPPNFLSQIIKQKQTWPLNQGNGTIVSIALTLVLLKVRRKMCINNGIITFCLQHFQIFDKPFV